MSYQCVYCQQDNNGYCDDCGVKYFCSSQNKLISIVFNQIGYSFQFGFDPIRFILYSMDKNKVILELDYHPDINPSNALRHLKTLLSFS